MNPIGERIYHEGGYLGERGTGPSATLVHIGHKIPVLDKAFSDQVLKGALGVLPRSPIFLVLGEAVLKSFYVGSKGVRSPPYNRRGDNPWISPRHGGALRI